VENLQSVSPSRQCSSTPVGFGQGFLSKEKYDNIAAFPELAPADIYLFPLLKSVLKGRRFCDASDIIKNASEELKSLSQNVFLECF
jgi:hypothetical protein